MKTLLITLLTFILSSCGISDYSDITMVCNGKLHNMQYGLSNGKFDSVVLFDVTLEDQELIAKFNNKKYGTYNCEWSEQWIECKKKTGDGNYQTNFSLRLNRRTGGISILDEFEKKETKFVETYEGKCEKSQGNKI